MKKESFIFLDIDGPINPDSNKEYMLRRGYPISSFRIELPKRKLELLAYIISTTGAKIVISSKWRLIDYSKGYMEKSPAMINLENQFSQYNLSIYSETPFLDNMRGLEIEEWLRWFTESFGYRPGYVVIDDNIENILDLHKGHIVKCNSKIGITKKEANIVINLLLRQNEIRS